jgi:hypothetical protein
VIGDDVRLAVLKVGHNRIAGAEVDADVGHGQVPGAMDDMPTIMLL